MPENAVVFPVTKFGHFMVREGYHLNGTGKLKECGTREGLFIDGKLYNGTSTNFSPLFGFQGNTYTGPVVDGRYSGHGKYTRYFHALQFVVYEGDFVRGMMHGKGRFEYVQRGYVQKELPRLEHIVYVGDFADDQFHGIGTLSFGKDHHNLEYHGAFAMSLPNGKGTMPWKGGTVLYEGVFALMSLNLNHEGPGMLVGGGCKQACN